MTVCGISEGRDSGARGDVPGLAKAQPYALEPSLVRGFGLSGTPIDARVRDNDSRLWGSPGGDVL